MEINIVAGISTINKLRTSNYFVKKLGYSTMVEDSKTGEKLYNTMDKFAHFYNSRYRASIQMVGTMANINFYQDLYINDNSMATYVDELEHIVMFDDVKYKNVGINSYLGNILRSILENKERIELEKKDVVEEVEKKTIIGDPSRLISNPGQVKYEDLVAYMQNRNK